MSINGGSLAGGNPIRGRVDNDFYATPPEATNALLWKEPFVGNIWEPACGDGTMSRVLEKHHKVISSDLVDRGYGQVNVDFLKTSFRDLCNEKCDNIITNPPFSLFQAFAEKALLEANGRVALFGKLQALEGFKRATFLEKSKLTRIYVFRKRINPMRNGKNTDENGKKWASTMAFAWYIWDKRFISMERTLPPSIFWL